MSDTIPFMHPWPQHFKLPQRGTRRPSLQRVYPEILNIIWEYASDLESLFALYGTCHAWRERVLTLPQWTTHYARVTEMMRCPTGTNFRFSLDDDCIDRPEHIANEFREEIPWYHAQESKTGYLGDSALLYLVLRRILHKQHGMPHKFQYSRYMDEYLQRNKLTHIVDRRFALRCVRLCGVLLEYVSPALQSDRVVALAAARSCGLSLQFASRELRRDREIVVAAIKNHGDSLQYADEDLVLSDKYIVEKAVKKSGCALQYAPMKWRCDRDVVMHAVRQNGAALQYLPADCVLRRDHEVMLTAVKCTGCAVRYVLEPSLRLDDAICTAAIQNTGLAYCFLEPTKKSESKYLQLFFDTGATALKLTQFPPQLLADTQCWVESIPRIKFNPKSLLKDIQETGQFFDDPQGRVLSAFARKFPIAFYQILAERLEEAVNTHPEFPASFVANVIGVDEFPTTPSFCRGHDVILRFLAVANPGDDACYKLFFPKSVFEEDIEFVRKVISLHPTAIQVLDQYMRPTPRCTTEERIELWVRAFHVVVEQRNRIVSEDRNKMTPRRISFDPVVAFGKSVPMDLWRRDPLYGLISGHSYLKYVLCKN